MRVLLVGFGPFPGAPFNPSAVLVKMLARRRRPAFAGIGRTTHVFATTYASVDRELPKLFAENPDIILIFGLAGRRRHLCIETQAHNAVSVLHPDASGHRPTRGVIAHRRACGASRRCALRPIARSGSDQRFSGTLVARCRTYLCNYAYWLALERPRGDRPLVQFVHIPHVRPGHPQFGPILAAAEALLIALMAASRR